MKRKHLPYLLLPLLVLAAVLVLFKDRWSTVGDDFSKLVFPSLVSSNSIVIESAIDSMVFIREGDDWKWNSEELNDQAVENLLVGASRLEVISILPEEELRDAEPILNIKFIGDKKTLSAFTVAKYHRGYLLYGVQATKLFGVELPGFENIPLEKIFSPSADHYRKHMLVDLLPDEVHNIEIYPLKGRAFRVTQDSIFGIRVVDTESEEDITGQVDEHAIRMLFSYFNGIRYREIYEEGEEGSTISPQRDAFIKVSDVYGKVYLIEVYKLYRKDSSLAEIFQGVIKFNDQVELMLMDYIYLDLLMRSLENYMPVPADL